MKNFNVLIKATSEQNYLFESVQSVIVPAYNISQVYDYVVDQVLGFFSDAFSYTIIVIREIIF